MAQGKLKWFDPKKGYGFITPDDDSKDVFLFGFSLEIKFYNLLRNMLQLL